MSEEGVEGVHHSPCMLEESLQWMALRSGQTVVDMTVGLAGHALEITKIIGPSGTLVGFEWDAETLALARKRLAETPNAHLVNRDYVELPEELAERGIEYADAVLLDAGVNWMQLTSPHRGMSQHGTEGLDMRMSAALPLTAGDVVNHYDEESLREVLRVTQTEREARRIARAIVNVRRAEEIAATGQLADIIRRAVGPQRHGSLRQPGSALLAFRIHVNDELGHLVEGIERAVEVLRPQTGRLVVLTFHSAEFRACKKTMRRLAKGCTCPPRLPCVCGQKPRIQVLTPRPPGPDEASLARSGPTCRSCRLHAAQAMESG